jgi:hypothetical protein
MVRDEKKRRAFNIPEGMPFSDYLLRFIGKAMLRPQLYWITDYKGEIPLDFIGRFENLQDDFHSIAEKVGMPPNTLPHELKSNKEDYRDHYSATEREIVGQFYQKEIALFNYRF